MMPINLECDTAVDVNLFLFTQRVKHIFLTVFCMFVRSGQLESRMIPKRDNEGHPLLHQLFGLQNFNMHSCKRQVSARSRPYTENSPTHQTHRVMVGVKVAETG